MTTLIAPSKPKPFKLTDRQKEALKLFASDAEYILLYGGSRSAKTFLAVRAIVNRALMAPGSRHAILRFRFNHVKASIIYDTFPTVMKLCFPGVEYNLSKSDWYASLPNGSEIWFGGLDDKERTEKILGNEYVSVLLNECSQISYQAFLIIVTRLAQTVEYERAGKRKQMRVKMYLDENPPMRGHWTHRLFLEKIDPETKRPLEEPELYASILMNPIHNQENLPESYLKSLARLPKRQRDRFLEGKFGDESENALWTTETIEGSKVTDIPQMVRIVVAVDPSGASDDPEENNDDIGIVVMGLGTDGLGYVMEDLTLHAAPAVWGNVVATAYERHRADRVVGEANFGGAMVEFVIKTANQRVSYKAVTASRGKMLRAEPIAALHETGKIKLVGDFPDLEDEMLASTTTGYAGKKSPNRLDAFVFAATELFPAMTKKEEEQPAALEIPTLRRFA